MKKESFLKKELVKPTSKESKLQKEVEALCPEFSSCPRLRRQSGQGVNVDHDILF